MTWQLYEVADDRVHGECMTTCTAQTIVMSLLCPLAAGDSESAKQGYSETCETCLAVVLLLCCGVVWREREEDSVVIEAVLVVY